MVGISCTEDVLWGKPRIAGTRISVDLVYSYINDGRIDQIYRDYPHLTQKQVLNAINYLDKKVHQAKEKVVSPSAKA